jgi:hypothetical protein
MITPLLDVSLQGFPDWSLSERDVDVLAFLTEEEFNFFTFEGLKRRLGLHPETLSRILNRLEAEGMIQKSSEGYSVTKDIARQLKHDGHNNNESRAMLLQTFLPSDMPVEMLVSSLRGRWFGLLRWLGLSKNEEGLALKWITEDGDIQVDAKITMNALSIEAKFLHGYDRNLALKAAFQLMTHISKLCARSHSTAARHIGFFDQNQQFFVTFA